MDGFVAGPSQGRDDPIGLGGLALHEWHWHAGEPGHEQDAGMRDELLKPRGAFTSSPRASTLLSSRRWPPQAMRRSTSLAAPPRCGSGVLCTDFLGRAPYRSAIGRPTVNAPRMTGSSRPE